MTTRQWQVIDACIDSEVSVESEKGDPRGVIDTGRAIRRAGWDQVAHWTPGVPGSGTWPPVEQTVIVELAGDLWALVVSALERWADVSDRIGEPEHAGVKRAVRSLVLTQVGELLSDVPE
ncbi:hypothetical protein F8568_022605 [Actinomadura sp. LD22]|uniref:Uncharacterized protein n=1 Tax=Actinomadura physcomitrii TaxID=2650748 RepID=A0A6I4MLL3_9ACTN|nr:hypothetical protein [Actinomadura physcomitrii]MWA02312.1 hypothetical protein [Actinomadura physcomitrii]MWA03116.1 hypothetical protein [Actinomadura physcomitrii]